MRHEVFVPQSRPTRRVSVSEDRPSLEGVFVADLAIMVFTVGMSWRLLLAYD